MNHLALAPPKPMAYTGVVATKADIRARAAAVKLPPPTFVVENGEEFAIIRVRMDANLAQPGPAPASMRETNRMTTEQFVKWMGDRKLYEVAEWLNGRLDTRYNDLHIWRWKAGQRPVPTRVAAEIREAKGRK